jgi:hypothetical protein
MWRVRKTRGSATPRPAAPIQGAFTMSEQEITVAVLTHHIALTTVVGAHCAADEYARSIARAACDQEQRARWLREWYCDDGRPARSMPKEVCDYLRQRVDWSNVAIITLQAVRRLDQTR